MDVAPGMYEPHHLKSRYVVFSSSFKSKSAPVSLGFLILSHGERASWFPDILTL